MSSPLLLCVCCTLHVRTYVCLFSPKAACYDFHSHSVWASCAHWIGAWHSPGKTFVPAQRLAHSCVRRSVNEQLVAVDDNSLPLSAAISMILDHVGLQSCLLVPGVEAAIAYKHSYPLSFLEQCCDLLENSLSEGRWSNCLSLLVSLQVCAFQVYQLVESPFLVT